jgi:hypothetical protein
MMDKWLSAPISWKMEISSSSISDPIGVAGGIGGWKETDCDADPDSNPERTSTRVQVYLFV